MGSNFTCRFQARTTLSGDSVMVRFSNAMGSTALTIAGASVGPRASGSSLQSRAVALKFAGLPATTIEPGQDRWSDAADLAVSAGKDVTVSIFVSERDAPLSSHSAPVVTNGCTDRSGGAGDHSQDMSGDAFTEAVRSDWWIDALAVRTPVVRRTFVALGDSITDASCVAPDSYGRWTDVLASRLAGAGGVANEGITGNVLGDDGLGTGAAQRLWRDVLRLPGAGTLFLFEGTNDIFRGVDGGTVIAELRSIVASARSAGLIVLGSTIIPRSRWGTTAPAMETARQIVNQEIRRGAVFDSFVDFDALMASPADPGAISGPYDCDQVHPSAAGLKVMGEAVSLSVLASSAVSRESSSSAPSFRAIAADP